MDPNGISSKHRFQSIDRGAPLRAISRKNSDDRQRNSKLFGNPSADSFTSDLREAVVADCLVRCAWRIGLVQWPVPLVGVCRSSRAVNEAFGIAAVVKQISRIMRICPNEAAPTSIHTNSCMKDVGEIVGKF